MAASLDDLNVAGKRVLLRGDLNVPMVMSSEGGRVTDTTRIDRLIPSIRELAGKGARVILMSHFGRPKGRPDPAMSLRPLLGPLRDALGEDVTFADDCVGQAAETAVGNMQDGDVVLLENLRFHAGEEANDAAFANALSRLGDLYVNDAFSAAHRAHASTAALAALLPAAAGRLMQAELEALDRALGNPQRPVAAIVGGAKVSTKIDLLANLVTKVDLLVIGGAMANTFLKALGTDVGKSLCENEMGATALDIMARADTAGCEIGLPADVVVARKFEANASHDIVPVAAVPADAMILDIGPGTAEGLARRLGDFRTLVWNGPVGAFEVPPFDAATVRLAHEAAALTKAGSLVTVAGGGDTVAALSQAGVVDDFSYVSTAGGAFLEWMEGKELPGVAALG